MGGAQSSDEEAASPPVPARLGVAARCAVGDRTGRLYKVGELVEYCSATLGEWIEARVEQLHGDGTVTLDCRGRADPAQIRPLLCGELERLINRTAPLVDRVTEMKMVVHTLTQLGGGRGPDARELRQMEREGRAVLAHLHDCCRELGALIVPHDEREARSGSILQRFPAHLGPR
jgi:hypothetical protein